MEESVHENSIVDILTTYCCNILPGQRVVVECIDIPQKIVVKLINRILSLDATPLLLQKSQAVMDVFAEKGTTEVYSAMAATELFQMQSAEHFIGLRAPLHDSQIANVPLAKMQIVIKNYIEPVHYRYRNHKLNWVYLRWPSEYMAIRAGMNYESFVKYYQTAIYIDFEKLDLAMDALVLLLKKTRTVHVKGPGATDLRFKLNDIGTCKSVGKRNLPDGEVFTAPVRDSINGVIEFNVDSTYYGTYYSDVKLIFEGGKVIAASSKKNSERLQEVLNIDPGASYVGEFAFGLNPNIDKPINDILFDEKMYGSIHFALGNAYPVADNGNRSGIHWDLILNQNEAYGGGEIYFDDILIRKDGKFVLESLHLLNPEYL